MAIPLIDLDERVVALDPDYCMRKENNTIHIFPKNPFVNQRENRRLIISSPEAVLLALCNGERNIGEVKYAISGILQIDRKTAGKILLNCLSKFRDYLVPVDNTNVLGIAKYRPEDFILKVNDHDLRSDIPSAPELIMLIPTFSCHCRCRYCYAPRDRISRAMDLPDVKRLTMQMKEMRIPSLVFSGGDPFSHPRIMDMIQACVDNNVRPILATKIPLSPETIHGLKKLGIGEMQVSIDSSDRDTVEYLVGKKDYFDRIVTSIKFMVSEGISVNINSVLTSHNIQYMEISARDFANWGVKQITLSQYSRSRFSHDDELFCRPCDLDSLEAKLPDLRKYLSPVRIYFKRIKDPTFMSSFEKDEFYRTRPVCNAGRNGLVVLPDGSVTVCEILYYTKNFIMGNVKDNGLGEIWNSPKRTGFVSSGFSYLAHAECARCGDLIDCYTGRGKCFIRALQAYGNALRPDPFCPKSPPGKRFA